MKTISIVVIAILIAVLIATAIISGDNDGNGAPSGGPLGFVMQKAQDMGIIKPLCNQYDLEGSSLPSCNP